MIPVIDLLDSKVEDQITFVAKHSNAFYIEYEIEPKMFWDFKLIYLAKQR